MRTLLFILILVLSAAPSPVASAGEGAGPSCRSIGVTNYYGTVGEPLVIDVGAELNTFDEFRCRVGKDDRIRLFKSVANTPNEVEVLRLFAQEVSGGDWFPTLFCMHADGSAHMLDLAANYSANLITSMFELNRYGRWAQRRASANPSCVLND